LLEAALEEIRTMRAALEVETLSSRILGYIALRESGHIAPPHLSGSGTASAPGRLRREAGLLLRSVMLRGEVGRGEITRITGLGERSARMLTSELLGEGLLESGTHRQPVRLGLPVHAVRYWFPMLFPDDAS
jgi:hypothetical protein